MERVGEEKSKYSYKDGERCFCNLFRFLFLGMTLSSAVDLQGYSINLESRPKDF